MSRMVRAGMQRTRAMVRSAAVFLVAVTVFVASESMVDHVNIMHCQVDLLLDEFGVVMLEMSAEKKHCCGSLLRFLKAAQVGPQPWKLEGTRFFLSENGAACKETCEAFGEVFVVSQSTGDIMCECDLDRSLTVQSAMRLLQAEGCAEQLQSFNAALLSRHPLTAPHDSQQPTSPTTPVQQVDTSGAYSLEEAEANSLIESVYRGKEKWLSEDTGNVSVSQSSTNSSPENAVPIKRSELERLQQLTNNITQIRNNRRKSKVPQASSSLKHKYLLFKSLLFRRPSVIKASSTEYSLAEEDQPERNMDAAFREAMAQQHLRLLHSPLYNSSHELLMVARFRALEAEQDKVVNSQGREQATRGTDDASDITASNSNHRPSMKRADVHCWQAHGSEMREGEMEEEEEQGEVLVSRSASSPTMRSMNVKEEVSVSNPTRTSMDVQDQTVHTIQKSKHEDSTRKRGADADWRTAASAIRTKVSESNRRIWRHIYNVSDYPFDDHQPACASETPVSDLATASSPLLDKSTAISDEVTPVTCVNGLEFPQNQRDRNEWFGSETLWGRRVLALLSAIELVAHPCSWFLTVQVLQGTPCLPIPCCTSLHLGPGNINSEMVHDCGGMTRAHAWFDNAMQSMWSS